MKFSICIPNYNYAAYLGATFKSILDVNYSDIEVVVSDNASTDGSLEIIRETAQKFRFFNYQVNSTNVGFAPNLDKAAALATGDYLILLSSDDLIKKEAIATYNKVIEQIPGAVVSSAFDIIDSNGNKTGRSGPNPKIWMKEDIDENLSKELGCPVYKVKSHLVLKRSLLRVATPFNFCTVAYPRSAYTRVGGYEATRLINPDKWFHWKLLSQVEEVVYIDKSLFKYRWHGNNQTAQQLSSGHLKYMVDEYRNTMEMTPAILSHAGISREDFIEAFIQLDIYKHGLGEFSKGRWLKALRIYFFGLSTYPAKMIWNKFFLVFSFALVSTPVGSRAISLIRK